MEEIGEDESNWVQSEADVETHGNEEMESHHIFLNLFQLQQIVCKWHVVGAAAETLAKLLKIKCTRLATEIQSAPSLTHFVKLTMPGNL